MTWTAETVPLRDLVVDRRISYGIVQPGGETSDGVPIVRVKDLQNGSIDKSSPLRVDPAVANRHARTTLRGGEVLLSLVGTVGVAAIVPRCLAGWNVARAIAVIRPANVEARWLKACLETRAIRERIDSTLNTTVQSTLNLSDLGDLPISLPASRVRAGILGVLGALDDKIAANAAVASSIDSLLEAVLAEQLTMQTIEFVTVSSIAEVNLEIARPSPDGLRYVDIAAVGTGSYDFPPAISWDEAPGRARRRIHRGDTLWSTVRPNRRSHALNLSSDPLLVGSTGLAVISPRATGFAYLYQVTKLPEFVAHLESKAEGSAYPAVRADAVESAPIPLVPRSEIERFESIAAPLREHAHSLGEESRTLANLRDTLLPHLMSGRLRVKDAEKQVEAVV